MPFEIISKPAIATLPVTPNLPDYEAGRASFSWDQIADELDWLPGGKGERINVAYEAIDRHVKTARRTKPAILSASIESTLSPVFRKSMKRRAAGSPSA